MTQEYTPVSWQDETTSQQGTLINAERLNQMQTAHHFADGLEEVDTIPTADPGVDYHKIVYCTADSTLYRWDGTEWTADIDDETKRLLEEEIARATEAERTIQGYLDAHEANHSNPHVVTKSQVGLGNCDNTADLDKPISTATQTALNAKADKSDTYTKAQVDTALATKADKATTYTKTETDTLLGAKADKATTYTKTEIDTAMATKADQATTYTKSEADTLLAGKASTAAVQTLDTRVGALETNTYTKSQVDTYLAAKLDTLSTAGLHAYTHSGATQSEVSVIDGMTASTIPIRDTNGRLQAADPASGSTDKSLVTANWVSQSGDSAPNNIFHRNGNEKFNGIKTGTVGFNIATILSREDEIFNKWFKVAKVFGETYLKLTYNISFPFNNTNHMFMDISVSIPRITNPNAMVAVATSKVSNVVDQTYFAVAFDGSDYYLFIRTAAYVYCNLYAVATAYYGNLWNASDRIVPIEPVEDDPTTYQNYVVI